MLQSKKEEPVQRFIAAHPLLLGFLNWDGLLLLKHPLGDDYVTDFVALGLEPWSNSPDLVATFVEIESPAMQLFTKAGNPSARLEPGDLIWSGTMGSTQAMEPGDVYEVEIEGVGILRNRVVQGR